MVLFFGCKNKNYSEFKFQPRGSDNSITIKNPDSVRYINSIINNSKEIKDILKYPNWYYFMICKNKTKTDTMFVSNFYLMDDKKCFKTEKGLLEYVGGKTE